jgi:hypothetical protein
MSATVAPVAAERYTPTTPQIAAPVAIPWPIYAALLASTSIIVGVIWDISWHMTIGRDSFWTPAHLAIQLGGIAGGLSGAFLVLRTSFAGSAEERAAAVRFWGFRGPLGAFISIMGAGMMLTSAPFDDWWHNAYGLDVEILSPPHTILALGIGGIAVGTMLTVVRMQNRTEGLRERTYSVMYAYAAGVVLTMYAIMATEYTGRIRMHSSMFYMVSCGVFPLMLAAASRASKLRWPATTTAAFYTAITALMVWILPLFPAEPKLGPIYQHVTHMVPMDFPLLLIVPAFVMDLVRQRTPAQRGWVLTFTYGLVFFVTFVVAQWVFAEWLMHPGSRNWFFATDNYNYGLPTTTFTYRHAFYPGDATIAAFSAGMGKALLLAIASSWLGLHFGNWMRRVRR